jgi:hypothetical protein
MALMYRKGKAYFDHMYGRYKSWADQIRNYKEEEARYD